MHPVPTAEVGNDSQTSHILALRFGLVPPPLRAASAGRLAADIRRRGTKLSTGFIGTPYILDVLADHGHADLAHGLLLQTDLPSWGYRVGQGATTVFERWDGLKDGVVTGSLNHYAFGAVCGFVWRRIIGIDALEPGFRRIAIRPLFDPRLPGAAGGYESVVGRISSTWRRTAGGVRLDVAIPANTTARVELPGRAAVEIGAGAHTHRQRLRLSMQRRALLQLGLVAATSLGAPTLALAAGKAVLANAHGAVGDGRTLNTRAIQAAIDEAARTGATIAFKPGVYRTGSIFLKSGVTLRLDKGVTLLGSQNLADYPELPTRVAGIELTWPAALINVYKQKNVRIVGDGIIDGDGKVFWDSYWALRRKYDPKGLRWAADYDCKRPRLIQIFDSEQVELAGPRLRRAGCWTVHVCYSHDIHVADLEIRNNEGGRGPSTDGVDIDPARRAGRTDRRGLQRRRPVHQGRARRRRPAGGAADPRRHHPRLA
ncbi:alpha-L-rhamnosidase C-terminal domain-containing protein [Caulobacter segnis]